MATGRPDPVAVSGHYLAPGRAGPVRVHVEVLKTGKRFSTASARLIAGDRTLLSVVGTLGELDDSSEALHADGAPPALPPPNDCVRLVATDTFPPPFMDRVDVRLHPDDAGFVRGEPSGSPVLRGWFRLLDDEPVDPVAMLLAVDSFPPTIFNADLPVSWSPTVELTAHVRARPTAGWLACAYRTRFISGGFLEVDGEVWDATGALVAQSRQLALVPRA
jgi:acyl-CoA thioesterase